MEIDKYILHMDQKHQIRDMTWQEARPASEGKYCTICGQIELDWGTFGLGGGKRLEDTICPGPKGTIT